MTLAELPKHTFVTIHGLNSDAGRKLNRACGIVIDNIASVDADGNTRLLIRIYAKVEEANGKLQPIHPAEDKKIKTSNLRENAGLGRADTFRDAAMMAIQAIQMQPRHDVPAMDWWMGCYYKVQPDEHTMAANYGSVVREAGRLKEASAIMWNGYKRGIFMDSNMKQLGPDGIRFLRDFAFTFTKAGEHLDLALDLDLKIPYEDSALDDPEHPTNIQYSQKKLANDALNAVTEALDKATNKNDSDTHKF
jgi:hypothetical protein